MNAKPTPNKRDLTPLNLTDAERDAMAGVDGFTVQQLAEAKGWGTPRLKALLAAVAEGEEDE